MLAAKTIRIRALLNFGPRKTGGHDSRAGMHLDLMNDRADARNKKLVDPLEGHGAFGQRNALHAQHFFVGGKQQIDLPLDRNAKGIFQEGILPGVHVGFFGRKRHVCAFRERGGLRDGDRFGGASLHAFAGEAVGGSKSPSAARDHANADAERFGFDERADFAVFRADFALADVHDARVGVGGAAALGRLDRPVGPVLHHARGFQMAEICDFHGVRQRAAKC